MTELTDEAVKALLSCPFCGGEAEWKSGGPGCAWISCKTCLAETGDGSVPRILAAWNRRAELDRLRAEAQVAVALVVERAEKAIKTTMLRLGEHPDIRRIMAPQVMWGAGDSCISAIRALAPADGLAAVEALRQERDNLADNLELEKALTDGAHRRARNAEAELAQARADAQAAVALAYEAAADACVALADQVSDAALTGLPEQARLRESMEAAFTKASHIIRSLAPADGLAAVEALRKERDRFEAALGRACLVGGTTYLIEIRDRLAAELAAAQQRLENGLKWCDLMDGPVSKSQFVNGQATAAQQIRAALSHNGRKGE